jgi:hypothetical protein
LEKQKNQLAMIEENIRKVIDEKEEKNRGKLWFFSDIVKGKKNIDMAIKEECKKSVNEFMKGDYQLTAIRNKINQQRILLSDKIKKYREKEAEKEAKEAKKKTKIVPQKRDREDYIK